MTRPVHTKSTSGRTHRLTYKGEVWELRYKTTPQFDDQVQGDLWRKARDAGVAGMPWPSFGMATIDLSLDVNERDRSRSTPEDIAQRVLDNHAIKPHWVRDGEQVKRLLAEAIRIERGQ